MLRIFKYKITNYDSLTDEKKLCTAFGIVVANSCSEAAQRIEDLYGEENILTCTIEVIEDDYIKETSEKIFNELKYPN
jgi:hypothetical protein